MNVPAVLAAAIVGYLVGRHLSDRQVVTSSDPIDLVQPADPVTLTPMWPQPMTRTRTFLLMM